MITRFEGRNIQFSAMLTDELNNGMSVQAVVALFIIQSFAIAAGPKVALPRILCAVVQDLYESWFDADQAWECKFNAGTCLQIWVDQDIRLHGDVKLALQFIDLMEPGSGSEADKLRMRLIFSFVKKILGSTLDNQCKQRKVGVKLDRCISIWLTSGSWTEMSLVRRYELLTQNRIKVDNEGLIKVYGKRLKVHMRSTFSPTAYSLRNRSLRSENIFARLGKNDWAASIGKCTMVAVAESTISEADQSCYAKIKFKSG